jgi:hypothetical protein
VEVSESNVDDDGEEARQTSATGGNAGKRGDRYEIRWAIVRGVVPILVGDAISTTMEPPGGLGDGIEFSVERDSYREVHQAKREHARSQWTIHALITDRVLDRLGQQLNDPDTHAVFVSGTGADDLKNLARRARLPDAVAWRNDLTKPQSARADELIDHWKVDDATAWSRLSRLTVETVSHESLEVHVKTVVSMLVKGSEDSAVELLSGYLSDELNRPLGQDELWTLLRNGGHPPRDGQEDRALSERLRLLTERYVTGVEVTRPAILPFLERPEIESALDALRDTSGPRSVAVVGAAGSGKSSVVAAVVGRLRSTGTLVAPIRLDQLVPTLTADALGNEEVVDLGGSIAKVLGRAAGGESAVLVLDQLDALSAVSGRGEVIVDGVRETLYQARALPNVSVLVACRAHDLQHDRNLRALLAAVEDPQADGKRQTTEIPVGDLDDPQLDAQLGALGVAPGDVHQRLRGLLKNFFNLSLLALMVEDRREKGEAFELSILNSRLDLLREVDRRFSSRIRKLTGATTYGAIVQKLAMEMSDAGNLSLPESTTLADQLDVLDALRTVGVLVADGGRLRFFHQSYFEYAFAQGHLGQGLTAMDLVRGDLQDIMRRGQVRSVLALERDSDFGAYMEDIRSLLFEQGVRIHIQATVLNFLGDLSEMEGAEVEILREVSSAIGHPLRERAMWTLARPGVARFLARESILDRIGGDLFRKLADHGGPAVLPWLDASPDELVWILANVARTCPDEVAVAIKELASSIDAAPTAVPGILRMIFVEGEPTDLGMTSAFVDVMDSLRRGVEGTATPELPAPLSGAIASAFSQDAVHALHTLAVRTPAGAVMGFGSWLALADAVGSRSGEGSALSSRNYLLPDSLRGLDTLECMVQGASQQFVELMMPRLLAAMQAEGSGSKFSPAGGGAGRLLRDLAWPHGGPYLDRTRDEVISAVMRSLALEWTRDTGFVESVLDSLTQTDFFTAHIMAASVMAESPARMVPRALAWARQPEVRGLPYAGSAGWSWGRVLARAVEVGTPEERAAATELILEPYRDVDLGVVPAAGPYSDQEQVALQRAYEQHGAAGLVLRAWQERPEDTPDELIARWSNLEERFGPIHESPGGHLLPLMPTEGGISNDVAQRMSDEEWLAQLQPASPGSSEVLAPTAAEFEIGAQLQQRAREEPGRFAQLLTRFTGDQAARFSASVLTGLSQSQIDLDEPAFADVLSGIRSVWASGNRHAMEVCQVVGRLSMRHELPPDIVDMVVWTVTEAEDPPGDDVAATLVEEGQDLNYQGINCERGFGVAVTARLLGSAHGASYIEALGPALEVVPDDPSEQVRMYLPSALLRFSAFDATRTVEILERWLERATDRGLIAVELPNLTYWAGSHDPALAIRVARRMVDSDDETTRATGGNLATVLAWREQSGAVAAGGAIELLEGCLNDNEARAGAALALGDLVDRLDDDLSGAPTSVGWSLLLRLLDDDDEKVRSNVARFVHNLDRQLEVYSTLLKALANLSHLDEVVSGVLSTLKNRGDELPDTLLDLLERWLPTQGQELGNPATAAYGTGMYVTELVLDLHAQSARGSETRGRCLDIIDRLIELGALDVLGHLDQVEE